jgi:hypothetical protein
MIRDQRPGPGVRVSAISDLKFEIANMLFQVQMRDL